ncbi:hypothetical protein EYF80_018891 [Liparis tanakae]|uniref:Uncharacterized protein n=1 Tax=Liparis tanakae TaxID=230148 RepID=A0A4Z2HYI5_9TELE|nr:hypothetical protein EYF80_018891 [Liparis tanakae]
MTVVKRHHRAYERGKVDHQHLVVGLKVRADFQQLRVESFQAVNLICDPLRQSAHCGILDISGYIMGISI